MNDPSEAHPTFPAGHGIAPPMDARRPRLSDVAIEEQTRALAAPVQRAAGESFALLCFQVAGERFALPATSVERVFAVPPIRRIPHRSRPAFRGMLAHEGEILLVGSLERLLDLAGGGDSDPARARMVLLGPAGRGWAFEASSVDGIVQVQAADTRAAPVTLTRGLGTATRRLVPLLDGEASLLDPEALRRGWEAAAS